MEKLTLEEATKFFAELYFGEHHIPGYKLYEFGQGYYVKCDQLRWGTFDYNHLTRFVLMCHEQCIRGEIRPHNFNQVKVIIHKRKRDGGFTERHPTIVDAISEFDNNQIKRHIQSIKADK